MITQLKYILVLVLAMPIFVNAQKAPGYLGKSFSVGYDAFVFPSFHNPNSPNAEPKGGDDLRQKGVSLNLQHNLSGQWSFSKRSSLIASVGYVRTNYVPDRYSDDNTYDQFTFEEYPSMSATSFAAGIRIFTQHYAPLGKFVEFRLGFAQVKTDDFEYTVLAEDGLGVRTKQLYVVDGGSTTMPTIAIAFGSNRVINDLILVSYGLDFNFFPGGFGYHVNAASVAPGNHFAEGKEGNTADNQYSLLRLGSARYGMQAAVNLRVGIGILL